jgi:phosphatidylglycerol---prolipoprotein diacylglyceryl transferase
MHYIHGRFWGGLLAYFALAVPAALLLTNKRRAALDLVALSVPLPFLLGKLGCFLQGCFHGGPTSLPWGVIYPQNTRGSPAGIPLHPTQLYEMLVMLGILLVFRRLNGNDAWRGTMIPWFLATYGFGRALCDTLRDDLGEQIHAGPLTLTQVFGLGAAALCTAFLIWRRYRLEKSPPQPGPAT